MLSTGATTAYDPFAGDGHLLRVAETLGFKKTKGLDVDPALDWRCNDSLMRVPTVAKSIIVTNPPYLSNYSAKRKGLRSEV